MRAILSAAILAAFLAVASPAADAAGHQICVSHDNWAKSLYMGYQERLVAAGITAGGHLLEVFASPDGETWTILYTPPGGLTCGLASGEAWLNYPDPPDVPTEDEDAI